MTVLPDTPSKLIGPDVTATVGGTGVAFGWTVAATGTVARRGAGRQPGGGVFVAVEVHYLPGGGARAAAAVAADASFCHLLVDRIGQVAEVPPYQPGQFCLRELPPLHAVLDGLDGMRLLIVDGYADLDPGGRPGLGAQAHTEFGVLVIGVAKDRLPRGVPRRAGSAWGRLRPAAVCHGRRAAPPRGRGLVQHMAGRYRLPDALRRADALARGRSPIMTPSPGTRSSRHMSEGSAMSAAGGNAQITPFGRTTAHHNHGPRAVQNGGSARVLPDLRHHSA